MTKQITFEDAQQLVMQHVKARNWDGNSQKGLAISILLEASELLEYYQWQDKSFGTEADLESELADIMIYVIQFADQLNIDIPQAITKKLAESAKKYPVEIFLTADDKERAKRWLEAKRNYKKDTTL